MDNFEVQELIFEVSKYRSDILKDIDKLFAALKENHKDLAAKKELTEKIKEFSGVKQVVLTLKTEYTNASVIPIYNQIISTDLINLLKDFESGENLKNLNVIEEPSKYIKKVYIIIGIDLINMFSPRELTSILLHELGHVYTYTSNLPRLLLNVFQKLVGFAGEIFKTPILAILNLLSLPAYLIASLIIITLTRSLTFLEHKAEYRADQFPIKYGYGDEFVKVLHKLHNKQIEIKKHLTWYEKLWNFINSWFVPSTHPTSSKRINEMSDKILDDYKKLYPNLDKELNIILKDIKHK
jgi:Zn-dependent protease with chaperone function